MATKTNIIVNLKVEAIHHWPGIVSETESAPELKKVLFLQYPHRHIFHIQCKKEVTHNDRDIEIILFKRNILDYLNGRFYTNTLDILNIGATSCEMLADELCKVFGLSYCEVLEDGENGAEVFYEPSITEVIDDSDDYKEDRDDDESLMDVNDIDSYNQLQVGLNALLRDLNQLFEQPKKSEPDSIKQVFSADFDANNTGGKINKPNFTFTYSILPKK